MRNNSIKRKNYKSEEPCIVCGENGENMVTYHHFISRGANGTDDDFNKMPLCLRHHQEIHSIGARQFSNNYHKVKDWLAKYKWHFDIVLIRWSRN